MNPLALPRAELVSSLVLLLALMVVATLFFGTGIYVVSGRWSSAQPKRDAKAIARWEELRQRGFLFFATWKTLPFFFAYFFAGTFADAWRRTRSLALSPEEVIHTGLFASAVALAAAGMNWFLVRRRAEEAHDRAARLQDERTG